jgi:8-oxo-dGTP diphosphatase
MKNYVVGFLFSKEKNYVLLIEKNRPTWQKGKWNGVGGHIEVHEAPIQAMVREFEEETGLKSTPDIWDNFLTCDYDDATVYFFKAIVDGSWLYDGKTMTDETVRVWGIDFINSGRVIPNLKWIIPLALDPFIKHTNSYKL